MSIRFDRKVCRRQPPRSQTRPTVINDASLSLHAALLIRHVWNLGVIAGLTCGASHGSVCGGSAMKARLLVTVTAVVFAAGTVFVAAQQPQPGGSPGVQGQPGAEPKGTPPKSGTQPKSADPKAQNGAPPGTAQPKTTPEPKGTAQPKDKATEPKGTAQPKEKATEPKGTAQPKSDTTPKADTKAPKTGEKATPDQKSTVNITTEQRTEIRQTIVKQGNAPRVTNVNFNVSVGAVVPSTVQVVVLPPRVVEIYPQWRGYRYFIVGERIIIVEPDTLRIVFIIDA